MTEEAMRRAFEAFVTKEGQFTENIGRGADGRYTFRDANLAWRTWQAATRASAPAWQPTETAPKQEDHSFLVRRRRSNGLTYTMQVSWFEGNMYPDHLDSYVGYDDRVTDATHWAPLLASAPEAP